MSNEINDTLKAIHKTLALIHKELVISNLPEKSRRYQRYFYTLNDAITMYVDFRNDEEEKMDRFSEGKTCAEAESNLNYIKAKEKQEGYQQKIDQLQDELAQLIVNHDLVSHDDIYDIDLGDYR